MENDELNEKIKKIIDNKNINNSINNMIMSMESNTNRNQEGNSNMNPITTNEIKVENISTVTPMGTPITQTNGIQAEAINMEVKIPTQSINAISAIPIANVNTVNNNENNEEEIKEEDDKKIKKTKKTNNKKSKKDNNEEEVKEENNNNDNNNDNNNENNNKEIKEEKEENVNNIEEVKINTQSTAESTNESTNESTDNIEDNTDNKDNNIKDTNNNNNKETIKEKKHNKKNDIDLDKAEKYIIENGDKLLPEDRFYKILEMMGMTPTGLGKVFGFQPGNRILQSIRAQRPLKGEQLDQVYEFMINHENIKNRPEVLKFITKEFLAPAKIKNK